MKKTILVFLVLLAGLSLGAQAQQVVASFRQAEGTPYAMQKLDAQYKSALHDDAAQAVFTGPDQQKMAGAYQQLLQELGKYLKQNGFAWGKPTRAFNRFYFRPDGTIDYYLFHIAPQEADERQQAEFQRLMAEFIKTHRIQISAPEKFSQCSPVVYKD